MTRTDRARPEPEPAGGEPRNHRRTAGKRAAVVGAAGGLAVVVAVVAGVAAYAGRPETNRTASPSFVTPSVAGPGVVSPSVTAPPSVPVVSSAPPSPAEAAAASPARTGCGGGAARVWASWPMPNPAKAKLPHPARYTDRGDGTVRDGVSCLIWQRAQAPVTYTFAQARSYCGGLALAGGGWHLPTRVELTSLVDTTRSGPAINTGAFPGTAAQFFWTSSPWAVTKAPARAWIINFYEGLTSNGAFQTGSYRVRCVRSASGSGTPAYRIAGGRVTDPGTGLTWQQGGSPQTMTAAAATSYCAALGLGGHGWRLPSVQELATTVDESRVAPAIVRTAFPGTARDDWYWTASTSAPEPAKRWALNYDDGYTNYRDIDAGYARCVYSS